jgi:hypothetical protein
LAGASRIFASTHVISRFSATRLLRIEQYPANHVQIGERRRDFEPVPILRQAPVANFAKAKDILYHTEHVLDLSSHSRFVAVLRLLGFIDLPMKAITLVGEVLGSRRVSVDEVRVAVIA